MPSKPQKNTSLQISVEELLQKPVWYVSLQHSFDIYNWNGEIRTPTPLSTAFRQMAALCECREMFEGTDKPSKIRCVTIQNYPPSVQCYSDDEGCCPGWECLNAITYSALTPCK